MTCLLLACLFFFARFLNMCRPRTKFYLLWRAGPPGLTFYGGQPACLPNWLRMMYRLAWFHAIRNFLANEIYHFSRLSHQTGYLFTFYSPLNIINSLLSQFCLFQDTILHKMLKLGFWCFKSIFLRMQFSLFATFFSLVLNVFTSETNYLTFWKPNGLSKHLKVY